MNLHNNKADFFIFKPRLHNMQGFPMTNVLKENKSEEQKFQQKFFNAS